MRIKHPWIKVACLLPFTVTLSVLQFIQASMSFPFSLPASPPTFFFGSLSLNSFFLFLTKQMLHLAWAIINISAKYLQDITCNFTEATNNEKLLLDTPVYTTQCPTAVAYSIHSRTSNWSCAISFHPGFSIVHQYIQHFNEVSGNKSGEIKELFNFLIDKHITLCEVFMHYCTVWTQRWSTSIIMNNGMHRE